MPSTMALHLRIPGSPRGCAAGERCSPARHICTSLPTASPGKIPSMAIALSRAMRSGSPAARRAARRRVCRKAQPSRQSAPTPEDRFGAQQRCVDLRATGLQLDLVPDLARGVARRIWRSHSIRWAGSFAICAMLRCWRMRCWMFRLWLIPPSERFASARSIRPSFTMRNRLCFKHLKRSRNGCRASG